MRIALVAAALVTAWTTDAAGQTDAGQSTKGAGAGSASSATTSKAPAPQGSAPPPTTTPGESRPQNTVGGAGVGAIVDGKPRVCVVEPKATTKTVHGSVCREYCSPRCSVWKRLFSGSCFGGGCECDCCEHLHRRVLTKKTVPHCNVPACVLKEAPVCDVTLGSPSGHTPVPASGDSTPPVKILAPPLGK